MPRRILTLIASLLLTVSAVPAEQPPEGMRTVSAARFGIVVQTPAAWTLSDWSRDSRAFVLRLPQDDRTVQGLVSCELAMAPEALEEFQKRVEQSAKADGGQCIRGES